MLQISIESKKALEKLLKEFKKGELILLGGRPGTGKSTLVLNLALIEILKNDKTVVMFDYENSLKGLINKILPIINDFEIINDTYHQEKTTIKEKNNIYIETKEQNTADDIVKRCQNIAKTATIDLLIIDYLQLINISKDYQNYHDEVEKNLEKLKKLAQDLNITIIITSQLGRKVDNKIPEVNDLKVTCRNGLDKIDKVIFLDYQGNVFYHQNKKAEHSLITNIRNNK